MAAITYCARNLTDGFVPYVQARRLLAAEWTEDHASGRVKIQSIAMVSGMDGCDGEEVIEHVIALLCSLELWHEVPHGYELHDYLDYNPSREQVLSERGKKQAAGRAGGQQSVAARRHAYGTAQPQRSEMGAEPSPEAPASTSAEARAEAGPEAKGQAAPKPVPVPVPVPVDQIPVPAPATAPPTPPRGVAAAGGLSTDPRAQLGDRLVVELASLMAGGMLSPADQKRVRNWPWAYQHLARLGEGGFLPLCRQRAEQATARGERVRSAKYFEAALGEADAAVADGQAVPTGRGHDSGMTRLGDMLPRFG